MCQANEFEVNTTAFGMYINYADSSLNSTQAHQAYWLKHYAQLSAVKKAWDPRMVFSNPQAVMDT